MGERIGEGHGVHDTGFYLQIATVKVQNVSIVLNGESQMIGKLRRERPYK